MAAAERRRLNHLVDKYRHPIVAGHNFIVVRGRFREHVDMLVPDPSAPGCPSSLP